MNPVTIRRLLVAAVCAAGVATLYVLPTPANSPVGSGRQDAPQAPSRLPTSASGPQATAAPPIPSPTLSYDPNQQVNTATQPTNWRPPKTRRPVPTPPGSSPMAGSSTTGSASTSPTPSPTPTSPPTSPSPSPTPTSPPTSPSPSPTPSPTPTPPPDTTPPGAPPQPQSVDNNHDTTTIGWPHADETDGVSGYEVYRVNGGDPIEVPADDLTLTCTESGCTAVIEWLTDETGGGFFIVAVDSSGNRSTGSEPVEVVRPEEGGLVGPSSSPSRSTSQETPS
ncbi:hypothetical protein [Microlunatus sp. Y2014]|uniref:hypothetical protein n=1 Tax=Microlunatus sp. Y2014 TaxID=3418488 RepID=UPI003DA7866E